MSEKYCVMNMKKNKRADVKGLQDEANRTAKKYKNNIKKERTKDNYFFKKCDDWNSKITEVLEENSVEEKSKSVVLITSVYSASPEFFEGKSRDEILEYFEKCLEFECRNGEVISAVVHFDEGTPHLQTAKVPVLNVPVEVCSPVPKRDEKGNILTDEDGKPIAERHETGKQKGKIKYKRTVLTDENGNVVTHKGLSARFVFGNKAKMSKTQTEFYEMCGKPYGLSRGEIRVETQEEAKKHLTEAEYKAKQIVADAKKREDAVQARESALKAQEDALRAREEEVQANEKEVAKMENETYQLLYNYAMKKQEQEQVQKELQKREDALQAREIALKQQENDLNARAIKWRSDMQKSFNDKLSRIVSECEEKVRNYKVNCDEKMQEMSNVVCTLPKLSDLQEMVLKNSYIREQGKQKMTRSVDYLKKMQDYNEKSVQAYRDIPEEPSFGYSQTGHDWGYGE